MARNKWLSYLLLYPMSVCFGAVVGVRNWMFNHSLLSTNEYSIPVITVGNISVGGTGKTPHTEYIIDALRSRYHMATLSRGYKRATSGFVIASESSRVEDIGDEALQMYRKYGDNVTVAVCERRVDGIDRLLELDKKINMVVLDDAFQHRYVKPTLSIVLTDYSRPVYEDKMLPFGRLREPMSALNRADIVIVTKCPPNFSPRDMRLAKMNLNLYPYQKLYFSTFDYGDPVAVWPSEAGKCPSLETLTPQDTVLSLTGIDNPRPFVAYLRSFKAKVKIKRYADHHSFSHTDMDSIERKFDSLEGARRLIFTTEKDAMRLRENAYFPDKLKKFIYYIPVKVRFLEYERQARLEDSILSLIKERGM